MLIKLCRAAFYTHLLDNPPLPIETLQELAVPKGWLSNLKGVLRMLLGLDVIDRFPDPLTAIHSCKPPLVSFFLIITNDGAQRQLWKLIDLIFAASKCAKLDDFVSLTCLSMPYLL